MVTAIKIYDKYCPSRFPSGSRYQEVLSAVASDGRIVEKSVDSTRPPTAKGNRWVDPPPGINSTIESAFVWIT